MLRSFKIKHVTGLYRSMDGYPQYEDMLYEICNWYYEHNGYKFMHNVKGLKDEGKVVFSDSKALELLGKDRSQEFDELLKEGLDKGEIAFLEEKGGESYYRLEREID